MDSRLATRWYFISCFLRSPQYSWEQRLQPAPKRAWGTPWFMIMANALRAKKSNPKPLYCIVLYISIFYIIIYIYTFVYICYIILYWQSLLNSLRWNAYIRLICQHLFQSQFHIKTTEFEIARQIRWCYITAFILSKLHKVNAINRHILVTGLNSFPA